MDQWVSNLSPFEVYLIAAPAIMLGAILFLGGIILLLEPRNKNYAEKLAAIRRALEKAGAELNDGKRKRFSQSGAARFSAALRAVCFR
jgi:hypothetical protein